MINFMSYTAHHQNSNVEEKAWCTYLLDLVVLLLKLQGPRFLLLSAESLRLLALKSTGLLFCMQSSFLFTFKFTLYTLTITKTPLG